MLLGGEIILKIEGKVVPKTTKFMTRRAFANEAERFVWG